MKVDMMDMQTIFLARLATTQGIRSAIVKITLVRDDEWGDEYITTAQTAGNPRVEFYKGEYYVSARKAAQQVIDYRELVVKGSAKSIADVTVSAIIPTRIMTDING